MEYINKLGMYVRMHACMNWQYFNIIQTYTSTSSQYYRILTSTRKIFHTLRFFSYPNQINFLLLGIVINYNFFLKYKYHSKICSF